MPEDRLANVVIITALGDEKRAVLPLLDGVTELRSPRTDRLVHLGYRSGPDHKTIRIAVHQLQQMGNIEAAAAATELVSTLSPELVVMVGIAGGIDSQKQQFGQVIVAEQVSYGEMGKITEDGVQLQPNVYRPSPRIMEAAHDFALGFYGRTDFGTIVASEKVVASSQVTRRMLEIDRKTVGIDMESGGVAHALTRLLSGKFLCVRGVSDFADERKDDRYREVAAKNAATWAVEFIVKKADVLFDDLYVSPIRPSDFIARITTKARAASRQGFIDAADKSYTGSKLKEFCVIWQIDYDNLSGGTKREKIVSILEEFERDGRSLDELKDAMETHLGRPL